MIRKLMASSAMLALMTAGTLTVAQAQTEPATTEQPAVIEQDATTDQGAAATTEDPAALDTAAEADATTQEPAAAGAAVTAEADATLTPEQPTIATAFIGQSVFSSEDPESDNIGEVNDLIIGDNGMITHAVVGVGGFLGIGEKNVAVPFDELQVVEREGDIRLIYAATREQLEAAEQFDRTAYDPSARFQEEQAALQPAPDAGLDAPLDPLAPAPAGDMSADTAMQAPADDVAATDTDAAATDDMAASTETDAATDDMAATDTDAATTDMAATDTAATGDGGFVSFDAAQIRATTMIGKEVYGADEESIGEVSDLVLQEDGETRAALVDVGGFLGVGEKEVAIPFGDIQVAQDGDETRLTIAMTREELEALAAYERLDAAATDMAAAPVDPNAPAETAEAPADPNADATTDMAAGTDASGDYVLATQDISADELIGSAVYSPTEENLGDVGDVIFDQNGAIQAVVVDVGGFLGVGEKPVAVEFDALNVQKDVNGDVRLMVNATQEQLEAAPSYDETASVEGEAAPVQ